MKRELVLIVAVNARGLPRGAITTARQGLPQRALGFTTVSMVFILVVLAALAAALASISQRQQLGFASEMAASRAYQAAVAGLEWGTFQMLRTSDASGNPPACFGSTNLTFAGAAALSDFTVTVQCSRTPSSGFVADGATNIVFYQLTATACNLPSGGACPNSSSTQGSYVERQLSRSLAR